MKREEAERGRARPERTTIQEGPLPYGGITRGVMGRGEITIKATVNFSGLGTEGLVR